MFWHTPNLPGLHGIVIGHFNGEYHLFTTKGAIEERTIQHAVSTDAVRWRNLPDILGHGEPDAFDGYTLYDLQVIEYAATYYLFYTGIDKPTGPGQRQAIGLAVSKDLIHWERHSTRPVLEGDPHYYEPFVPDHATYQEKDRGRQWFRDPWVYRDPETGRFGMAVGARAAGVHPDVNGCFAWAESDDLIHWQPMPPLYCPRRFHTMECPVVFEQGGRTYLIWLTHPEWGTPLVTTDPWQRAGGFYAFSEEGLAGPWLTPRDEILIGGAFDIEDATSRRMRAMVVRTVVGLRENNMVSYHLNTWPGAGDDAKRSPWQSFAEAKTVMPLLKPVRTLPGGDIEIGYNALLDAFLVPEDTPSGVAADGWRHADGRWSGKSFKARNVQLLGASIESGLFAARVRILRGLRAGLILRAEGASGPGLYVVLDRNLGCVELGALDAPEPIDRRQWTPRGGWVELRVVAHGPSLEIYCDGKLMLHQVRYRERQGKVGLVVDRSEAQFEAIDVRSLKPDTPLLTG